MESWCNNCGHDKSDHHDDELNCLVCSCDCFKAPLDGQIIAAKLICPKCLLTHVDEHEWETRPHRTHLCFGCGNEWEVTVRGVEVDDYTKGFEAATAKNDKRNRLMDMALSALAIYADQDNWSRAIVDGETEYAARLYTPERGTEKPYYDGNGLAAEVLAHMREVAATCGCGHTKEHHPLLENGCTKCKCLTLDLAA